MISIAQIQKLENEIVVLLNEREPTILIDFPIQKYINTFQVHKEFGGYHFFNESSREFDLALKSNYQQEIIIDYYRLFLLKYIELSIVKLDEAKYPENIQNYFNLHFERTFNRLLNNNITFDWIDFNQDKFCKEFSVLRLEMLPVGPQLISINKLSFRMFNRHGFKALIKGLYCAFFVTRGIKPIYELHTNHIDPMLMRFFNEKGWKNMLMDLAQLMERDKSLKAVFGAAWFFDPVLKEISPEISYINRFATDIGSWFFKAKTRPSDIKDAIFMNPTRKKLLEEGKFQPRLYLVIMPRKKLIRWSKKQLID